MSTYFGSIINCTFIFYFEICVPSPPKKNSPGTATIYPPRHASDLNDSFKPLDAL